MANFQLGDSEQVAYSLIELDAASNPVFGATGDVISFVSSDTASITVVADATAASGTVASGLLVGGTKVQTGVTVSATVTHADGTTLSVTDTFDLVGGAASSLSLALGAPTAKGGTVIPPGGTTGTGGTTPPSNFTPVPAGGVLNADGTVTMPDGSVLPVASPPFGTGGTTGLPGSVTGLPGTVGNPGANPGTNPAQGTTLPDGTVVPPGIPTVNPDGTPIPAAAIKARMALKR